MNGHESKAHKGPVKGLCVFGPFKARTHYALRSILEVKRLDGMPDRFYTENRYNKKIIIIIH